MRGDTRPRAGVPIWLGYGIGLQLGLGLVFLSLILNFIFNFLSFYSQLMEKRRDVSKRIVLHSCSLRSAQCLEERIGIFSAIFAASTSAATVTKRSLLRHICRYCR